MVGSVRPNGGSRYGGGEGSSSSSSSGVIRFQRLAFLRASSGSKSDEAIEIGDVGMPDSSSGNRVLDEGFCMGGGRAFEEELSSRGDLGPGRRSLMGRGSVGGTSLTTTNPGIV